MKKIAILLAICMILGSFSVVLAANEKVVVGEELTFEDGNGPIIINDRLMLPLRAISEALDATIYWFNDGKRIQIVLYDTLLSLAIDNSYMGVHQIQNGKATSVKNIEMEVPATIHNDRTYVPIRAISEAFSATVQWDNTNRTATIVPKERTDEPVLISEISYQEENSLLSVYGVICKNEEDGSFYLRSLLPNVRGNYDEVPFCTPTKAAAAEDTEYATYTSAYFEEQFGTEDPSGTVVAFTGVNILIEEEPYLVISKTTTGMRSLGYYDEYMRSLGLNYETFDDSEIVG